MTSEPPPINTKRAPSKAKCRWGKQESRTQTAHTSSFYNSIFSPHQLSTIIYYKEKRKKKNQTENKQKYLHRNPFNKSINTFHSGMFTDVFNTRKTIFLMISIQQIQWNFLSKTLHMKFKCMKLIDKYKFLQLQPVASKNKLQFLGTFLMPSFIWFT